jgi:hypothetical protein
MATIRPPFQGAREGSNGALDLAGFEAGLSLMQKVNAGAPAGLVTHYIAVKAGAPKPDIGTPEAFKRAMLAAKSIAYSRTGVSALVAEYSPSRTRATLVSIMYKAFPLGGVLGGLRISRNVRCWHCVTSNAGPHGGA